MTVAGDDTLTTLPLGLTLCSKEQSLETVTSNSTVLRLLASGSGTEIADIHLKKGEHIVLVPGEGSQAATELYLLLEGRAYCALPGQSVELGVRDYVITEGLTERSAWSRARTSRSSTSPHSRFFTRSARPFRS